jgi:adenylate cyclase class IV
MDSEFFELEYKYNGDDIKLSDFIALATTLLPKKRLDTSSWDIYYTGKEKPDEFLRYRESDTPELTIKRKVKSTNNWERIEIDLPLDPTRISKSTVDSWVHLEGYSENFKIFKSCFIFWYENFNLVYYIVYNENMKEKGRFIEIEINKDKVPALGLEGAVKLLKEQEQTLVKLGINPQNRLKRSLFEMFSK